MLPQLSVQPPEDGDERKTPRLKQAGSRNVSEINLKRTVTLTRSEFDAQHIDTSSDFDSSEASGSSCHLPATTLRGHDLKGMAPPAEDDDGVDEDEILEEMFNEVENASVSKTCNFGAMRLKQFPSDVLSTSFTSILKELILCENSLELLPAEAFTHMPLMTRLDLSNNKLTTIPATILTLPQLEALLCDHNRIRSVPFKDVLTKKQNLLPRIVTLGLEWNSLEQFPVEVIQHCGSLEQLFVGENPEMLAGQLPSVSDFKMAKRSPNENGNGVKTLQLKIVNQPSLVKKVEDKQWATQLPWFQIEWNNIYPAKVLDFLYLGSLRTAQTPQVYKDLNIGAVLSVGRGLDVKLLDNMQHLVLVVDDVPGENMLHFFTKGFEFIEEARQAGHGILIHCFAGLSRSVTICVAYIMKTCYPMTCDEALALVRTVRPNAQPNAGFMKNLHRYEELLKRGNGEVLEADQELLQGHVPIIEKQTPACVGFDAATVEVASSGSSASEEAEDLVKKHRTKKELLKK